MSNRSRVIVALDFASAEQAVQLTSRLDPTVCRLKVGKELFTRSGPQFVSSLVDKGFDVFLDLKFHDIPNTVAKACQSAAELGVWMVNVHASGGSKMMIAAREALEKSAHRPKLIAVTVLTSMSAADLHEIGIDQAPMQQVLRLAQLTNQAGLDGVVCSPLEVSALRESCGTVFALVTPGVRPAGAAVNDQQRIMTPGDAIKAGADYLVIGRPITQADDPLTALAAINAEIAAAQ